MCEDDEEEQEQEAEDEDEIADEGYRSESGCGCCRRVGENARLPTFCAAKLPFKDRGECSE